MNEFSQLSSNELLIRLEKLYERLNELMTIVSPIFKEIGVLRLESNEISNELEKREAGDGDR